MHLLFASFGAPVDVPELQLSIVEAAKEVIILKSQAQDETVAKQPSQLGLAIAPNLAEKKEGADQLTRNSFGIFPSYRNSYTLKHIFLYILKSSTLL
jgi:hypothetical protein